MTGAGLVLISSCLGMLAAWLVQLKTRDAGIVDVFWAFGMSMAGGYYAYIGTGPLWLRTAMAALTVVWFLRLGLHILRRATKEGEDGRYRAMRQWLGRYSGLGFMLFFQAQAGFIFLLSLPFLVVANTPEPKPVMVALGALLTLVAFAGEASADRQLQAFRKDPSNKGLSCSEGWWRFSRHPNYFFEWMHWFAYPVMGFGGPQAHWLWLAPVIMLMFLMFFTGVPFAEQQALRSRGDSYRSYQARTSVFFPWPPSKRV